MQIDDPRQQEKLKEFYEREEEDLAQVLADRHQLPYADLSLVSVSTDALGIVPEEVARKAGLAIFDAVAQKIRVAILSPKRTDTQEVIEDLKRKGYVVSLFMVSKRSMDKAWLFYKDVSAAKESAGGVFEFSVAEIEQTQKNVKDPATFKKALAELVGGEKKKTSHILERILGGAIAIGSSDVHIEPEEDSVKFRVRIDGVLQEVIAMPHSVYLLLVSRIKLLSGLKLNVKTVPQDGRYSIKIGDFDVEIRTSTLPGNYGESVVMRILNPKSIQVPLESLGIEKGLYDVLQKEMQRPNGMVLTTGPTGSGKTTVLYAILRKVYTPDVKIITIEDPIEYHLPGITQTQTKKEKGYTFAEGLRSSLRQDPDIIMVGEIRDRETAETAINAALTGHLVLSTLHTNTAAGVIPRFIDLGANPRVLSSAINVMTAQRLVRKLCPDCRRPYTPTDQEKKIVSAIMERLLKKRPDAPKKLAIFDAVLGNQCSICGGLGYKGRLGVFEGIIMDEAIEKIIVGGNPSESELRRAAEGQGLLTMAEDGILKTLQGITSLSELVRVIDLEE